MMLHGLLISTYQYLLMPAAMDSKEFEPLASSSQGKEVKSDDQLAAASSLARNYGENQNDPLPPVSITRIRGVD
jgi:hypothetical protein